jgi:hypothetical protein
METKNIQLVSCYGEVITCSVKEVIRHESGRITYRMDNKQCNDFHNSQYAKDAEDCRVRNIDVFASGKYTVYASYKNGNGNYRQGAQGIDAEILQII